MHINPLKDPAERVKLTKTELSVLERAQKFCKAIGIAESPASKYAEGASSHLEDVLALLAPICNGEQEAEASTGA